MKVIPTGAGSHFRPVTGYQLAFSTEAQDEQQPKSAGTTIG